MRFLFRRTTGPAPRVLDLYDIAYLSGGPQRMVEVALVALHERGTVRIRASRVRTADDPGDPADGHPFERAVVALCGHRSRSTRSLLADVETGPEVEETERRMVSSGLLTSFRLRLTREGKRRLKAAEQSGEFPAYVFEGPTALPSGALRRNVSEVNLPNPGVNLRLLGMGPDLDADRDGVVDFGGGHHSCGGGGGGGDY